VSLPADVETGDYRFVVTCDGMTGDTCGWNEISCDGILHSGDVIRIPFCSALGDGRLGIVVVPFRYYLLCCDIDGDLL